MGARCCLRGFDSSTYLYPRPFPHPHPHPYPYPCPYRSSSASARVPWTSNGAPSPSPRDARRMSSWMVGLRHRESAMAIRHPLDSRTLVSLASARLRVRVREVAKSRSREVRTGGVATGNLCAVAPWSVDCTLRSTRRKKSWRTIWTDARAALTARQIWRRTKCVSCL